MNRRTATRAAVVTVIRRRDTRLVAGLVGLGYLIGYLWAVQDLFVRSDVSAGITTVSDPVGMILRRTGPASFEAVAIVDTGVVRWLFSPMNLAIGLALALLVGISIALSYLAITQPKKCGLGTGSGVFAALPALLSGTVCCGPVVLLVLGLQATGALITLFVWALPAAVLMLIGSIVYLATRIDTTGVRPVSTD